MNVSGTFPGLKIATVVSMLVTLVVASGCVSTESRPKFSASEFHNTVCSLAPSGSTSPWHISKLYDCSTRLIYVPYQLWTGASWNGDRSAPCMHKANARFEVNKSSVTTITGPIDYVHPRTGVTHQVWSRDKVNGPKKQLFSCHEKGIGRLFDNRRGRVYEPGRCKFPAGAGWPINEKRDCLDTSVKITWIGLNPDNTLADLKFDWWFGSTFDHSYRYVPDYGMTNAWRQTRVGN